MGLATKKKEKWWTLANLPHLCHRFVLFLITSKGVKWSISASLDLLQRKANKMMAVNQVFRSFPFMWIVQLLSTTLFHLSRRSLQAHLNRVLSSRMGVVSQLVSFSSFLWAAGWM